MLWGVGSAAGSHHDKCRICDLDISLLLLFFLGPHYLFVSYQSQVHKACFIDAVQISVLNVYRWGARSVTEENREQP